jgi:hypothetical protein
MCNEYLGIESIGTDFANAFRYSGTIGWVTNTEEDFRTIAAFPKLGKTENSVDPTIECILECGDEPEYTVCIMPALHLFVPIVKAAEFITAAFAPVNENAL